MGNILHELERAEDDANLVYLHAEIDRLRAEIERLQAYRDEAESQAAIASLAVERLRLTEEEREAVERAIRTLEAWQRTGGYHSAVDDDAATLRGLLERLGTIDIKSDERTPKMSSGEPMTDHTAGQREPSAPSRGSVANHDAAPAAITVSDEDRTDKAATSHRRDRSGNTPVFDRSKPINDARLAALEELSALDQKLELEYGLVGNPMIKAQERKPPMQTTPGECSKPREGT